MGAAAGAVLRGTTLPSGLDPHLHPRNVLCEHRVTNLPFAFGQGAAASLYFDEDDLLYGVLIQPIKDNEIDWASDEPCVFRVVVELREIGNHVFGDLAHSDRAASLDGVRPNARLRSNFPLG